MTHLGHRMDRPNLDAEALEREHGGRIADMAVGDVRGDGQDVHGDQLATTGPGFIVRAVTDGSRK